MRRDDGGPQLFKALLSALDRLWPEDGTHVLLHGIVQIFCLGNEHLAQSKLLAWLALEGVACLARDGVDDGGRLRDADAADVEQRELAERRLTRLFVPE